MLPDNLAGRQRLEGRGAIRSAFDTSLEECRRSIQLFDVDGEIYGVDRSSVASSLRRVLLDRSDSAITLIVQDTGFIERQAARLITLIGGFAPRLKILKADPALRPYDRGFVIVDQSVVLRRPSFNQPLGFLDYDNGAVTEATALFEQLLGQSGPGVVGHPTGL